MPTCGGLRARRGAADSSSARAPRARSTDPTLEASAQTTITVADLKVEATASVRAERGGLARGSGGPAGRRPHVASASASSTGFARAEAKWDGLDAARLLGSLSPPARQGVRGRWRARSWRAGRRMRTTWRQFERRGPQHHRGRLTEAEPTGGATAVPALAWSGRTTFLLRDRRCVLELDHAWADAVSVAGRVEGRLAEGEWRRPPCSGPLRIVVAVRPPFACSRKSPTRPLAGRLEAPLALGGTIAAPEAKGTVQVRDLTAPGATPPRRRRSPPLGRTAGWCSITSRPAAPASPQPVH